MANKGQKYHSLPEKNLEQRTGVCVYCGPVRIYRWRGYWQCETVYRAAKERDSNYSRNLRYGVTAEQYEAMYKAQKGKCKICKKKFPVLHVDHCHDTNKVRGLLCGNCNRGLGLFFHNTRFLLSAWRYLRG